MTIILSSLGVLYILLSMALGYVFVRWSLFVEEWLPLPTDWKSGLKVVGAFLCAAVLGFPVAVWILATQDDFIDEFGNDRRFL